MTTEMTIRMASDAPVPKVSEKERDHGQHAHHHDKLTGRERDVRLLRLVGQDRIERDRLRFHVLAHLLAELFQHLFAARALFEHLQAGG